MPGSFCFKSPVGPKRAGLCASSARATVRRPQAARRTRLCLGAGLASAPSAHRSVRGQTATAVVLSVLVLGAGAAGYWWMAGDEAAAAIDRDRGSPSSGATCSTP